jgi:polyisoprenoid-binding protein YceI
MRHLKHLVPLALLALGVASPAWAGMTLSGKPKVSFDMTGNLLSFEGVSQAVTLKDDGAALSFDVVAKTISTGVALRDTHMWDNFVQVAQFPNVGLVIDKASVTWPAAVGESTKGTATAKFTLHGTTLDVPVAYAIKKGKDGSKVEATFPVNVQSHGVTEALSYMGISFEPVIECKAVLELVDAP